MLGGNEVILSRKIENESNMEYTLDMNVVPTNQYFFPHCDMRPQLLLLQV